MRHTQAWWVGVSEEKPFTDFAINIAMIWVDAMLTTQRVAKKRTWTHAVGPVAH